MQSKNIPFVYFGTPLFAVSILNELERAEYTPALVITTPDKPVGRKLILTPSPVKQWAMERDIPFLTPQKLKDKDTVAALTNANAELFIVAAYGKIIPEHILAIPKRRTINVHPSLLPELRGPSPIESAITSGLTRTGVSIMELDALMDHGPIIASRELEITWEKTDPPTGTMLEHSLAKLGGELLGEVIDPWMKGEITPTPQNHDHATYCQKIVKEDALITPLLDPISAIQKIRAYNEWPGAFLFHDHNNSPIRLRITEAHIASGLLVLDRVTPEGKKNMSYADFIRGLK